jgi:hypothetical protein
MPSTPERLPDKMQAAYAAVVALTDAFCDEHLNAEYKELAREMTAELCRLRRSPLTSGKPLSWAGGVLHALGRVNFLSDPSQKPHMKAADMAEKVGVSPATLSAKGSAVWKALDLMQLDPRWSLPSKAEDNPLIWILQVNGMLVDIRDMPREAQVVAYEQGLIPWIPADRERGQGGQG